MSQLTLRRRKREALAEPIDRRQAMRWLTGAGLSLGSSPWFGPLARAAAQIKGRHCVILWMSGGPSQMDTFDLKPQHANGGPFREIATRTPGMRISEHLPGLAEWSEQLALLRGVSTREGDHARGTYLMRTGQSPGGSVKFPSIGASLTKELQRTELELPSYFAINPNPGMQPDAFGPGFLGPAFAPATVSGSSPPATAAPLAPPDNPVGLTVQNLRPPVGLPPSRRAERWSLWRDMQQDFLQRTMSAPAAHEQNTLYQRAQRMMNSRDAVAFDLTEETDDVRRSYGTGKFGQGCLLARRLIERGVPLIEVTLGDAGGWDTHTDNFTQVQSLSQQLDQGWSTLMRELKERGLLSRTTFLWMGEFGRTPAINTMTGRDHFPTAWTCLLAGAGIQGGAVYGRTSEDGMEVLDGKIDQNRVLATLCHALGIDPHTENVSALGRPHKIVDGEPVREIVA